MADNENDLQFEEAELKEDASTDWAAEAKKQAGIAKRNRTKFDKATARIKELETQNNALAQNKSAADPAAKKGFDYAEKAYLKASGIDIPEFEFVHEVMSSTGKSIDDVLGSKYFQAELKDRREAAASKAAMPDSSNRAATSTRDTVEYWIAKGELPPRDQVELRRKVVNAKIKAQQEKSQFTDNPVA